LLQAIEAACRLVIENRYWGQILQFSLFFSLLAGNLAAETGSNPTASATIYPFAST
jgi:hypothetical protein